MLKKIKKPICFLIAAILLMSIMPASFAENNEPKLSDAELLAEIAKNLEVYARYESVDRGSLYEGAIKAIMEKNPGLLDTALSGMLSSIDEHSVYYTEEEQNKLFDSLSDEVVGIGVTVLERDGKILVSQPIPGTPAEKAGIKAGDIIVEADGISLENMPLDTAIEYIRGEEGTTVNVKIWRSQINGYIDFAIKREKVVSNPIEYEVIEDGDKKVARIQIFSFTQNADVYFNEVMDEVDKAGIKNIIIDLRNNGGGYLDAAVKIADRFLPKGAVILSEDHKIPMFNKIYMASGKDTDYEVVVLINKMSASASEVFAAALSENKKAKIIGEQSFGKGTVQSISMLKNGGVMKYTVAYYLTPNGNNIDKLGITPDATVKNSYVDMDMSKFGEFDYNYVYKLGDKSPYIETAKKMLSYIGLYIGETDDVFDENLRIAVNTFQEIKEGLYPYGVLDKTTQLSLYTTMCELKEEVDDQLQAALDAF